MTRRTQRASDDWVRAYSRVYQKLPLDAHEPCPNCGHDALKVVFVATPGERVGYSEFWCANCLFGVWVSRALIPDGVVALPRDLPEEEFARRIPAFTIVGDEGGAPSAPS
jgi:hypothetical protein